MEVRLNRNIHIADAGYTVAYKQSNCGEARCRTVKSVRQQRDEIKIIHRKRRDAVNRIGAVEHNKPLSSQQQIIKFA